MLRYSYSPSADMQLDNMYVALVNFIISRQTNQGFVVRVDDIADLTDNENEKSNTRQLLEKFAIHHDQLLHQSESKHRYQQLAASLVNTDKAFICTCSGNSAQTGRGKRYESDLSTCIGNCINKSPDELQKIKDNNTKYIIRVKQPEKAIVFFDRLKGEIITDPDTVDNFVILDRDGNPTYDFACAIDDMLGDISLVIREEEYIDGTPKQIYIRSILGFDSSVDYGHFSRIVNTTSIVKLLEQGFLPDAIINYLLISSSPEDSLFALPDTIDWFTLNSIPVAPMEFDIDKLRSINKGHLLKMDNKRLSGFYNFADEDIGKLIRLYLNSASTIVELDDMINPIFAPKPCNGEWGDKMKSFASIIASAPAFDNYDEFKSHIIKHENIDEEQYEKPMRMLMTGAGLGPDLSEIYPLIKSYILEVARCPH